MVVTVPLNLLVRLWGCFILNLANYVWPSNLEGLFNLPRWYFYHWHPQCLYDMQSVSFTCVASLTMHCGDEMGHPMDVPSLGLQSRDPASHSISEILLSSATHIHEAAGLEQ